jgi:hypothetical protein
LPGRYSGNESGSRTPVQRFGGVELNDPARFRHGDAVGDGHCLFLIVRDVHCRNLERLLKMPDLRIEQAPEATAPPSIRPIRSIK